MQFLARGLVVLLLACTIVSVLRVYPDQLTYFNELAGGPENGHRHLLHSNLDWGQSLVDVKRWIDQLPPDKNVLVVVTAMYRPEDLGILSTRPKTSVVRRNHGGHAFDPETLTPFDYVLLAASSLHPYEWRYPVPGDYQERELVTLPEPAWQGKEIAVLGNTVFVYRAEDLLPTD